jgi:transcription termination factor Rho
MSVLDRAALEASPLADLHAIASELSIDGYRRLRRPELIDAILASQSDDQDDAAKAPVTTDDAAKAPVSANGDKAAEKEKDEPEEEKPSRRRRGRRGGRSRAAREDSADGKEDGAPEAEEREAKREQRGRDEGEREQRGRAEREAEQPGGDEGEGEQRGRGEREDEVVSGVVELLANGSGFLRVAPPEASDDDVYISGAQVKRCELVSGDRISGPRRAPRRSERFASLIRIDTINDRPAAEVADSARFDDLPAAFPSDRFRLGSDDPTLKAIEWLTPLGRGSRVTIVGPAGAGKTEALRRLATALAEIEGIQLSLALAAVRPEEIAEWGNGPVAPTSAVSFAGSADAQGNAVDLVVDQARRVASRGAHAVVLIDTLDGLHPGVARKATAAARNVVDGGSLTVIATASKPIGGETTVIALDRALASTGRFPALDLAASGTIRAELLVGEAGAEAIVRARAEALENGQ